MTKTQVTLELTDEELTQLCILTMVLCGQRKVNDFYAEDKQITGDCRKAPSKSCKKKGGWQLNHAS